MRRAKIMIVDDDRDLAESLAELIEMHGHQVSIAANGKEAVERCREQNFDVTFMDVRMPVMNGVDSFTEIRKIRPGAKIVMMTGFKEPMVAKALEGGALGLLNKPFHLSDLMAQLDDATKPIVLLVDDDPDFSSSLSAVLIGEGYKTVVAGTGDEAIHHVRTKAVDVLILDLRLPVMDGIEVYQRLQADGRPPPTIIVSGSAVLDKDSVEALKAMSVRECFAKPVDPAALLLTIDQILAAA
ncbi:MAG: response regulator [Dongiaceae bacterium]